eukprot:CAMPEP_0177218306 /NCGR_PEP_ID=MMETSP0367-20130122/35745_1 /TAXON_ID=447022 ORGANISM="Scrippsiella hangoei-like, Strain SHHI-4" /NCGR_SAMPLE_ID=MMETSP0367 /ASSEMBLY_ACC=CAM_ASM_000362 /LENGTH=243 /DNA_ID=CAMNT_0018667929 /DNA_START=82 /DNA_END=813 /DNA_ORIENTATION=-
MALRSAMKLCLAPLRTTAPHVAPAARPAWTSPGGLGSRMGLATATRPAIAAWRPQAPRVAAAASVKALNVAPLASQRQQQNVVGGLRAMSSWRLRPYAVAGTAAMLPLSSLSAGFSKVSLSLLVLPWKALPTALCLVPVVGVLPAMYRMIFQNSMRHTTASVFTVILYLVLSFMPVPCFENLFSDLFFYGVALVSTFFMYTFFPEVLLHDFMFMHYLALFTIPLIPLAFAYMPMFAARSYLFL